MQVPHENLNVVIVDTATSMNRVNAILLAMLHQKSEQERDELCQLALKMLDQHPWVVLSALRGAPVPLSSPELQDLKAQVAKELNSFFEIF